MDVNRSESIAPVLKRDSGGGQRHREEKDEERKEGWNEPAHGEPWTDDDAVEIDGALGGAMSPEVRVALESLASQMEPMRTELERARLREEELRGRLERHPYLPVLNRHGLEHDVARIASRTTDGSRHPLFICLSISNAPAIRRRFGRAAFDETMTKACEVMKSCLDAADILGCLGGNDLGAIVISPPEPLAGQSETDADQGLLRRIAEAFSAASVVVEGARQPLQIDIGVGRIERGRPFAAVLAAADSDLIRRASAG